VAAGAAGAAVPPANEIDQFGVLRMPDRVFIEHGPENASRDTFLGAGGCRPFFSLMAGSGGSSNLDDPVIPARVMRRCSRVAFTFSQLEATLNAYQRACWGALSAAACSGALRAGTSPSAIGGVSMVAGGGNA